MKELKGDLKYFSDALKKHVLIYDEKKNRLTEMKQEEV
jgi:hypothetical protein